MIFKKYLPLLFFALFFSFAPKPQPGTIWLTQEELDNPVHDTTPMPVLNARCPYNDSISEKPVPVRSYKRKNGTRVKG
jgi:hypothetical protein